MKVFTVLLRKVAFVDEAGDNMAVLNVEVVMWTVLISKRRRGWEGEGNEGMRPKEENKIR